jgi:hypothetical protein
MEWQNEHGTQFRHISDYRKIPAPPAICAPGDYFSKLAAVLQHHVADAVSVGQSLLTFGSSWSFSEILANDGIALHADGVDGCFRLDASDLTPATVNPDRTLVLIAGMTKIQALNTFLEGKRTRNDLSMRTSGSYDGQRVAGMMATGVHGSAIGFGAFQNQVRGVHLITGPSESVWIENGPHQILSDGLVQQMTGSGAILSPQLFEAALVHLGGLGIVSAVLFEAAPYYELEVVRLTHCLVPSDLRALEEGRFGDFARRCGYDETPYFVEVVLNPFRVPRDSSPSSADFLNIADLAMITFYFERAPSLKSQVDTKPASHLLDLIGDAVPVAIREVAAVSNPLEAINPKLLYPIMILGFMMTAGTERMSWGQANGHYEPRTIAGIKIPLHNDAFAIARTDLSAALTRMSDAFVEQGGGHLVFTLRFVSNAQGTMNFTRFPETAVINVDGIRTAKSSAAAKRIAAALEADAPIAFSQHWGKMGDITKARFDREFGDPAKVDVGKPRKSRDWRIAREELLNADARRVFVNKALERWGLV